MCKLLLTLYIIIQTFLSLKGFDISDYGEYASSEEVTMKISERPRTRMRRLADTTVMPSKLQIEIATKSEKLNFELTQNDIAREIVLYKEYKGKAIPLSDFAKRDWEVYRPNSVEGYFLVLRKSKPTTFVSEGFFLHKNKVYKITPIVSKAGHYNLETSHFKEQVNVKIIKSKRSVTENVVEYFMVVDDQVLSVLKKSAKASGEGREIHLESTMARHFSVLLNGIDVRLRSLRPENLNIGVKGVGYYIMSSPLPGLDASDKSDPDKMLTKFKSWIKSKPHFPKFDHAILLSGHKFTKKWTASYAKSICTDQSLSVVQFSMYEHLTSLAAYSLGLSLGARDDGSGHAHQCAASNKNVMYPGGKISGTAASSWKYSHCSYESIEETMHLLESKSRGNCLQKLYDNISEEKLMPGKDLSIQDQCKLITGTKYGAFLFALKHQSDICKSLPCLITSKSYGLYRGALSGTSCGYKSWCRQGMCKKDNKAPGYKTGNCVFDDNKEWCEGLKATNCYFPAVQSNCCNFCKTQETGYSVCKYGDTAPNCLALVQRDPNQYCKSHYGFCCFTCLNWAKYVM